MSANGILEQFQNLQKENDEKNQLKLKELT